MNNSVSGTGGGDPTDPNAPGPICGYDEDHVCETEHPVEPTVFLSKTADPDSGTIVKPNDVLTYTLQVRVLNGPTQTDIVLSDELGDGLTFGAVLDAGDFNYELIEDEHTFRLPADTPSGEYSVTYTATVNEDGTVSVNNSVIGTGGGYPPDPINPTPSNPVCEAPGCETTHPLVPPVVTPVPLGSWPWNALLVGLLAVFALWLGRRQPAY